MSRFRHSWRAFGSRILGASGGSNGRSRDSQGKSIMVRNGGGERVLVVEDDELFADMVSDILNEDGYTVVGPFSNLRHSFEALEEGSVAIAVLDINLRDGTSFPLADHLASEDIPVIFLTSRGREEIPARYRIHTVLPKIGPAARLLSALAAVLDA
ncbi:MAG: response regulator [Alphaproteobacteria bacterium]|nr:response regulator [Alphaproteobacteria bacterium]